MELVSWLASHGSKARRGVIWGSTEIRASDSVDIVPPDQLQQFIHNIIRSHWTIGQHMTWIKQKAKEWTRNEVAIATTSPPDHNAMEHPRLSHPWLLSEISFSSKNRKSLARMDSEPGLGNVFGTLSGWLKLTEAATIFISLILHRCVWSIFKVE